MAHTVEGYIGRLLGLYIKKYGFVKPAPEEREQFLATAEKKLRRDVDDMGFQMIGRVLLNMKLDFMEADLIRSILMSLDCDKEKMESIIRQLLARCLAYAALKHLDSDAVLPAPGMSTVSQEAA